MNGSVLQLLEAPLASPVVQLALAAALGLFLGLEREWSQKSAGVRTFSLISLLGAVFTHLADELAAGASLVLVGGVLVIAQGVLLAVRGLVDDDQDGLSLTTSVSMLVAYGVGAMVATGFVLEGVTVAVISSLLLVLKRELHAFADSLSREEVRSATEFSILAFVVYPVLPAEPQVFSAPALGIDSLAIEPRVVWLMVVTVAGIGIVNYAVVQTYGGRGIAVTGFFGGLASSTAVVGTMLDHVRDEPDATAYAVAAILLANAAMAMRNLVIAVVFTLSVGLLVDAVVPLLVVVVGSFVVAALTADWGESVDMDLESPFSLRYVLGFGAVFLVVLVVGAIAQEQVGASAFVATAVLTGLVSSAGATTSAVLLFRAGTVDAQTAVLAVLLSTASSIVVKCALTWVGPNREFARKVATYSTVLLAAATVVAVAVLV
ncbi:MgtC/SapB family protein [Halorubellus sp. PRR65]|uniref:MgtC/SapB family protein n=1 Tax=Halorubellus sp. PRR65 TaxID=3098148 RepID=UPI002B262B46|nr:MgtC/SapB family protein [Halorubellus sp. PRR65]